MSQRQRDAALAQCQQQIRQLEAALPLQSPLSSSAAAASDSLRASVDDLTAALSQSEDRCFQLQGVGDASVWLRF